MNGDKTPGMSKPIRILVPAAIAVGVLVLGALGVWLGVRLSSSDSARSGVLSSYFRALADKDTLAVDELTAEDFSSDLPLDQLEPGSYRLYDFGAGTDAAVQRFMLAIDREDGTEDAFLAVAVYGKNGFVPVLESIRMEGRGKGLGE